MLQLYLDESGHEDSTPVFVVAGYIAPDYVWRAFEQAWRHELQNRSIKIFHATDCETRHREFKDWSRLKAELFRRHLLRLIDEHSLVGVGRAVSVLDYKAVVEPKGARFTDGTPIKTQRFAAITFCLRLCLEWIAQEWPDRLRGELISVIMEDGSKGLGTAINYCRWLTKHATWAKPFDQIVRARKHAFCALQAADLLAYETYRYTRKVRVDPSLSKNHNRARKVIRTLVGSERTSIAWAGKKNLEAMMAALGPGSARERRTAPAPP